jgi:hypothetical protein
VLFEMLLVTMTDLKVLEKKKKKKELNLYLPYSSAILQLAFDTGTAPDTVFDATVVAVDLVGGGGRCIGFIGAEDDPISPSSSSSSSDGSLKLKFPVADFVGVGNGVGRDAGAELTEGREGGGGGGADFEGGGGKETLAGGGGGGGLLVDPKLEFALGFITF